MRNKHVTSREYFELYTSLWQRPLSNREVQSSYYFFWLSRLLSDCLQQCSFGALGGMPTFAIIANLDRRSRFALYSTCKSMRAREIFSIFKSSRNFSRAVIISNCWPNLDKFLHTIDPMNTIVLRSDIAIMAESYAAIGCIEPLKDPDLLEHVHRETENEKSQSYKRRFSEELISPLPKRQKKLSLFLAQPPQPLDAAVVAEQQH